MKISTRSRYATRVLVELALQKRGRMPLGEVTSIHQVSRSYVERSISPLVHAGIIKSYRGSGGGISLGRHPDQIRLGEVIRLVEGDDLLLKCIGQPESCSRSSDCKTRGVWVSVQKAIFDALEAITIQDVACQSNRDNSVTRLLPQLPDCKGAGAVPADVCEKRRSS